MPQEDPSALRAERARLHLIGKSLYASSLSEDRYREAWGRVYERAVSLAARERKIFQAATTETKSLCSAARYEAQLCGLVELSIDEPEEDWDAPNDPGTRRAPVPRTIIAPRRPSSPRPAPWYASTPQYKQAAAAWPDRMSTRRADEDTARALESVYGECAKARASISGGGLPDVRQGRPRTGTKNPDRAEGQLLGHCPGRTIAELRSCLGRGKPSAAVLAIRVELKRAVFAIRDSRSATPEALATALGCTVRTVTRLRNEGAVLATEREP